jgi:type II secretory pathway pseudopilin PulG
MKNRRTQGFTLIEGVIILGVVGLISFAGWYAYQQHTKSIASNSVAANSASAARQPYWLINDGELNNVVKAGLSQTELNYYFNTPKTLLIITGSKLDKQLTNAQWVQPFTTLASIQAAFANNTINPRVKYILYDNEGWTLTPKSEQVAAVSYASQVETLVHQHNMTMIFTPATNLADIIGGVHDSNKYNEFISLNLAGQSAKVADIVDIQAQQAEGTTPNEFQSFVPAVLTQAKQASSTHLVFIGIGTQNCGATCPTGSRTVTGANILADYRSINPTKQGYRPDGYWFNIPGPGTKCVNCGTPDPTAAVDFLNGLYALPGHY